jgi:hypothetical protein
MKNIRRLLLLAALALPSFSSMAQAQGVLLIEVQLSLVSNVDVDPGDRPGMTSSFWVSNLATGKSYGGFVLSSSVALLEVPAGIYCLQSASISNVKVSLCAEPYFEVVAGRLNNAGRWRVGHRLASGEQRIYASVENPAAVLAEARKLYPERFGPAPKE